MDSRRTVLKKILVGTATAAAVPGTASAALDAVDGSARSAFKLPAGPAPWWLLAPVGLGSPLAYGWYVADLSAVRDGAAVLTLGHSSGRKARVHLCAHNGRPQGLASSRLVDLVLMDGGSGSFRTDEKLGRVVMGLSKRMRQNETAPNGDLRSIVRMMTHTERVDAFGPDQLV